MPALSIPQPLAWATIFAGRRIDNRPWGLTYRGPVLPHAAPSWDDGAAFYAQRRAQMLGIEPPHWTTMPLGAIIGRATITDCFGIDEARTSRALAFDQRAWATGPFCVALDDVEACEPVSYPGGSGFFEVPDHLAAALRFYEPTMPEMARMVR